MIRTEWNYSRNFPQRPSFRLFLFFQESNFVKCVTNDALFRDRSEIGWLDTFRLRYLKFCTHYCKVITHALSFIRVALRSSSRWILRINLVKKINILQRNINILMIFWSKILNCLVGMHSFLHGPGARLCYVCFCFSRHYHYLSIYKLTLDQTKATSLWNWQSVLPI